MVLLVGVASEFVAVLTFWIGTLAGTDDDDATDDDAAAAAAGATSFTLICCCSPLLLFFSLSGSNIHFNLISSNRDVGTSFH